MSENKKTSLQKAILEAREIELAAIEGAKKVLEESVFPKIEEAVKETVRELEEGVTIDVGDADVSINVEDGVTSVEVDANEEDIEIKSDLDSDDLDSDDLDSDDLDSDDSDDLDSEDNEDENDFDSEEDEEDIFEIEDIYEEEAPLEAPVEEVPVEEAPIDEMPAEEAPIDEMPTEEAPEEEMGMDMEGGDNSFPGLEDLGDKLDAILDKLNSAEVSAEETEEVGEAPVGEEAPEEIGAEGEIEIVDDEVPAEAAPEEEIVAEDGMLEITFEEDENKFIDDKFEFDFDLDFPEKEEEIEFDIAGEFEEELDEMKMMGVSNTVQKTVGDSAGPEASVKNRGRIQENKNNTQQEAKAVELEKENEGLRESLKEYKESFKILRKQINEVQTFNAKLAYVNKLFSKGGLTNGEKIQIAEDFDKVVTVEEAKGLYNEIISESKKVTTGGKTEQLKSKLKSASTTAIAPSTKSETLYESKEMSRMQKLAGIKTLKG